MVIVLVVCVVAVLMVCCSVSDRTVDNVGVAVGVVVLMV